MRFGVGIPTGCEGMYTPCSFAGHVEVVTSAQMAERLGFYSVWGADFMAPSPSMGITGTQPPSFYEILISLAYVSATTKRIKLGAGTVTLPQRDPVVLAKQAATLDVFSRGRLLLGVGLGAYRDEFEAVKRRSRANHRGEMFLEGLEALHGLLSQDDVSFKGRYYEFQDVSLNPKPVQNPLPLYIAGRTPDTARRVARWGNGWLLAHIPNQSLRETIETLLPHLEPVGRDLSEIDLAITTGVSIARTREEAMARFRKSRLPRYMQPIPDGAGIGGRFSSKLRWVLIGTPDEIAAQIETLEAQGVGHCIALHFAVNTHEELMEQMQLFAEEVIPAFNPVKRSHPQGTT